MTDANDIARRRGKVVLLKVIDNETDVRPPEFSDEALALRFAERQSSRLRYVAAWGKWFIWDEFCWRSDETLHAFDMVRRICREAAQGCGKPKVGVTLASAKRAAA